ncbi:uncharacterized protein LOC116207330 [Punica granatum]|uniref:Uncharacterized protein n=2 Tax=Punica granatum TaxID=22663 RepID=A0A218XT88_PUNGR|nr:uncharacterized protein LOC116207330 [Punica granatum]XP_031396096.1 uncharacterized protein LOC116207330 [Punica granatum]XP_031396097.1 uncharacterized protein LOC116207330 [Punica granatum]OWM88040.1 hypothetical protein CDL15_Pgr016613 [Punica granatum]PKI48085.1 hypothetical protein CRG98_031529 [Punica granatum]
MRAQGGHRSEGTSRHTKLAGRWSGGFPAKKSRKVPRKSLSSELSSTEDIPKELSDFTALCDALDANPDGEITEITDDSADRLSNSAIASLGVDQLANLLVTAQKQVLESFDANCQSKQLLEAVIKDKMDKLCTVSEQRAYSDGLTCLKVSVPFLCLVFGILLVIAFSSGLERSQGGIFPT